jgi:hypothetical protein
MSPAIVINVALLGAVGAWLATRAWPPVEAVRVRNAMLMRRGQRGDFAWTPDRPPRDFRIERASTPRELAAAVDAAGVRAIDGDWPRALALVGMLVRHARDEGGIRADVSTTFRRIVAGEGYCADYVRAYIAAARYAGLFCRQWAFSFDGFGGHGHTIVEVYDRQRRAWAFIDVHNNVYAVLAGSDEPLDALRLRDALVADPASIEFRRAAPGRLGFPHFDKLLAYYRRGCAQWYLWWGNDVVARDRNGALRPIAFVSGTIAHRLASAIGRAPALVALVTPDNERDVARMEQLGRRVRAALLLAAALAAALFAQLGWPMFEARDA